MDYPMTQGPEILRQKATTLYLMALFTVYPLFTGLSGYYRLDLKKFLLLVLLSTLFGLSMLVASVYALRLRVHIKRPGSLAIFTLLFLAAASVSTFFSPYGCFFSIEEDCYEGLLTWIIYCAILLCASRYGKIGTSLLIAFSFGYSLCCLIALLQLFGLDPLRLYPSGADYYSPIVQETGHFLGTMGNIDIFSAYHCLAVPLFVTVLVTGKGKRRAFLCLPLVMGLVCQIWAGVSSGLVAQSVVLALFFPHLVLKRARESCGKNIPRALDWSGALVILIAIVVIYALPIGENLGTIYELHCVLHGEFREEFGSHRLLIWREVVDVFRRAPWIGIGADSLGHYLDIHFERFSEALNATISAWVTNAHNEYLQFLVSFGICGSIPACCAAFAGAHRSFRAHGERRAARCLLPGVLCYMIQAFFNIGSSIAAPLFFAACGLLFSDAPYFPTDGEPQKTAPES